MKLIDADKLLEWVDKRYFSFDTKNDMYENIRQRIKAGTFDPTPPVQPDIKPGDRVRTIKGEGRWKGLEGIVLKVTDDKKAEIDFGEDWIITMTIPFEDLEVIK